MFDQRHASEPIEITILTGEHSGGASKAGGETLWTASANTLGYVDASGDVISEPGRVSWLAAEEQRGSWIHEIRSLTQYTVRVRRATPDISLHERYNLPVPDLTHHFALDEVISRDLHLPELDARLARRLEPVSITSEIGTFALDRSFGHFTGTVTWCGRPVGVSLEIDTGSPEGAETCVSALRRLEQCVAEDAEIDAAWRAYAAATLTELAEDWQEQGDEEDDPDREPVTPEAFARRIQLSELSVGAEGDLTPYYDDGDLFWGHTIVVDVPPDGTPTDASIAG